MLDSACYGVIKGDLEIKVTIDKAMKLKKGDVLTFIIPITLTGDEGAMSISQKGE